MARKEIHQTLCYLPRKIVSLHGTDHAADLVLHELCGKECFNFKKAAYFVDNPDFNCFKGIAGFNCDDVTEIKKQLQHDPEQLSEHLCSLPFNQKVRCCMQKSANKEHSLANKDIAELANQLGMDKPNVFSWDTKNDNHAVLIYETNENEAIEQEDLHNGLILLSFCPMH